MLQNLFGEVALDSTIKSLIQKLGRFSFNNLSQLRVSFDGTAQPVTVSSGTVTTVTTVTTMITGNMSIGDIGKPASSMLMSQSNFTAGVGKNFIRS